MTNETSNVLVGVAEEREAQDAKWGEQNHPDLYWLGILSEEVGESAKVCIEGGSQSKLRAELVQVAAVAVSWIECIDRRAGKTRIR